MNLKKRPSLHLAILVAAATLTFLACGGSKNSGLFGENGCPPSDPTCTTTGSVEPPPPRVMTPGVDGGADANKPAETADAGVDPTFETFGPCTRDDECAPYLCNWKLKKCATVAPNGTPCTRD